MSQPDIEAQKAQCPFCKIIKGEIPSKCVYQDDVMMAVLDINPSRKGHILVFPKEHYFIMPMVPPKDFFHMVRKTKQLYAAVRDAFLSDGMTIFFANGGAAGQQAGHFLYHIIPRDKNDGLDKFTLTSREINDPQIDKIQQAIAANMGQLVMQFYQRGEMQVPESLQNILANANKPSLEQLAQLLEQNAQLKDVLLQNRPQFEALCQQHDQLRQLFTGVNLDDLIKLLK